MAFLDAAERIAVLPDDLANQIAAGEVVERPASIVKELCENSLDAESARVDVEIASGGVGVCRVRDDGIGMSERDGVLSLRRHATSKITSLDDLTRIRSFGFRGEALPSIASVSRLVIETRLRGEERGTRISVEGGGEPMVEPCGAPHGTMVEVRDLFFNVPARRKFLRALPTESAHVTEVVESMALAHPAVSITLTRDGRMAREYLRASDREGRVRDVFRGEELARCTGERGPLLLEAFLSRPERARSGAGSLSIFVNGRGVRDRALARAVAYAYGSVLEAGRYPIGAVFLDLPLDVVDVNVHPQKSEVRFADGRAVSDAVFRVLEQELARAFQIARASRPGGGRRGTWFAPSGHTPPMPPVAQVWDGSGSAEPPASLDVPEAHYADAIDRASHSADSRAAETHVGETGASVLDGRAIAPVAYDDALAAIAGLDGKAGAVAPIDVGFDGLRFVAQLRSMFLVCEAPDAIVILDQHAAAERVTYHRLRRQLKDRSVARQGLLIPELVHMSPAEVALLEEAHDEALSLGIDVRSSGSDCVSVHAVPQILAHQKPETLVRDLLVELTRSGDRGFSGAVDLALATMACHGSLRAGDRVSPEEAQALLRALAEVDFGGHCPHGRPIVTRLSFRELEHRVGRR